MLKRLIIAVFVMGLVLSLSGTAFSDVDKPKGADVNRWIGPNTSAPRYNDLASHDNRPTPPPQRAIPGDPTEFTVLSTPLYPSPTPPSGYFCDNVNNAFSSPYTVAYGLPGSGGLRTSLAERFTGVAGNECTVKAANVLLNALAGTPDLMVYLYDDNGFGLPGAKLDSVLVLYACLSNPLCTPLDGGTGTPLVHVDFTNGPWVFSGLEEWHIAIETKNITGAGSMSVLGDNGVGTPHAGEQLGSLYRTDIPGWTWTGVYFPGTDRNFAIMSEKCCGVPFTDCYPLSYHDVPLYDWEVPNQSYGDDSVGGLFSVLGPESLKSVDVYLKSATAGITMYVTVHDANLTHPDPGTPLASVAVPYASFSYYPAATNVDFSSFNLVMSSDFYITVSTDGGPGSFLNIYSDEEITPTNRGIDHYAGVWYTNLGTWGGDFDYLIDANMCPDQFSLCSNSSAWDGITFGLSLPYDIYNLYREAQQFKPKGENCFIKTVDIWMGYLASDATRAPKMYSTNTKVSIYNISGGMPGANLGTIVLTPADYAAAGIVGFVSNAFWKVPVDFTPLNINVTQDYFVLLETMSSVRDSGIRIGGDGNGTAGSSPGWVESLLFPPPDSGWMTINFFFGGDPKQSLAVDVKTCCVPFAEYTCLTPQDWSTPGGNFARTGRSDASLSDAYCDLNRLWSYISPTSDATWSGPVIFNGRVIQVFTDRVVQFDILTGAINWTLGPGAPYGTDMRCVPTAATISIASVPTDVVFLVTGNQRAMVCVNWTTGVPVWTSPGPNGAGGGAARWGITSIANQAGTEVVYHCSEISRVVARVAETGALYGGWATNPVVLAGGSSEVTNTYNATDNLLYVATIPAAGNGDVYALNGATGAVVWQLSTAGLKGSVVWVGDTSMASENVQEGFSGHIAYESATGLVYINSRAGVVTASAQNPADGVFYTVNAATGAITKYRQSQAVYRSGPIIDQLNIIIPTRSHWLTGPVGGSLIAINREFGTASWTYDHPSGQGLWTNGLITCEPAGEHDQVYVYGDRHFMSAVDANTGEQTWERRMDNGAANMDLTGFLTSTSLALSKDGELAITDEFGGVVVLTKTGDRARMQFITYRPGGAVNFGVNPTLSVNAGWFMKNTGCVPLTIATDQVDATSPTGQILPAFAKPIVVGNDLLFASEAIANKMAGFGTAGKWGMMIKSDESDNSMESSSREFVNRAALSAPPVWFVSLDQPKAGDVINPGDSMELLVTVNQALINRGNNIAFLSYTSNDPDFFLNDPPKAAEARLTLIGGCITDTTDLVFGMGSANYEHVWNNGRLGDGDAPGGNGWHIDGDDAQFYQGSYIYAVSNRRFALNSAAWDGVDSHEWVSLQGDPNWCDNTCKPFLVSPYVVPSISTDGLTYNTLTASMICRSYIDSVQNFDDGGGWDVENWGSPFDNDSTMGLYVKSRVIGVVNEASLANVTIDIMDFTERNGRAIPGWIFGSMQDLDIGSDTSGLDRSVSVGYAWSKAAANGIWGQVKLPFGCGEEPTRNIRGYIGVSNASGFYEPNVYFDSCYTMLNKPPGTHLSNPTSAGDYENQMSHYKREVAPNDTFSLAIAHFGFPTQPHGGSGNTAPAIVKNLAHKVNKMVGWGRGDVNNDNVINLADVVYLAGTVNFGGPGAIPFAHLGDVDATGGAPNQADVDYLVNFYFSCGPCPAGAWTM